MNSSILHLGELASNNVVHDLRNGTEYIERVKEMSDEIYLRDSFEKIARPVEYVCNCYPNFSISKGMPKSIFADQFGYDMQKDISEHMKEFYAGKINKDELNDYFEECCSSMRIYRTQQCQTSGQNDNDNEQIVSQMYEIFAKENLRVAREVNYLEGEKINLTCGNDCRSDDWTYYNSDYYYKCNDVKCSLQQAVENMTIKWNIPSIDTQEIENSSQYTLDGGFDFNSGWNFIYRNQVGRSSIAKESMIPPKDFKLFYKESISPNAEDMNTALKGMIRIKMNDYEYMKEIPFKISRTGLEEQIFNVGKLTYNDLTELENYEYLEFLNNFSVFTRWYSWESGINNKFGDYVV